MVVFLINIKISFFLCFILWNQSLLNVFRKLLCISNGIYNMLHLFSLCIMVLFQTKWKLFISEPAVHKLSKRFFGKFQIIHMKAPKMESFPYLNNASLKPNWKWIPLQIFFWSFSQYLDKLFHKTPPCDYIWRCHINISILTTLMYSVTKESLC